MLTRYLAALSSGAVLALALLITPVALAEDAKTKAVEVKGIKLDIPEAWKPKALPPGGFGRVAQFDVAAVEGDKEGAEVVVSHFGPMGAGPIPANIDRWVKQFDGDERKVKIFEGESKLGKYVLVDLTGTWNKSIGPPVAMKTAKVPGSRVLGVILKSEKSGQFYIRLTGPEKTVTANAKALRVALQADPEKEVEKKDEAEKKE